MMKLHYEIKDALVELKIDLRNFNPNKEKEELVIIIDALLSEDSKKQEEAIQALKKICSDNTSTHYANAHVILGYCHGQGIILDKDEKKAFECYEIANKKGSLIGLTFLAGCYYMGQGIEQDIARAIHMAQTASRQGYAGAKLLLANYYEENKKHHESIKVLQEAIELKDPRAMYIMAQKYLLSSPEASIRKDIKKYLVLSSAAAEYLVDAQANFGKTYLDYRMDMSMDTDIEKYAEKAYFYLKKAMEAGHPEAGINLSYFYLWGISVERNAFKGYEILETLAQKGETAARNAIPEFIGFVIDEHVIKDDNKNCCAKLYSKAETDTVATPVASQNDLKKVFELLNRAAAQGGHSLELALCYERGMGVDKNLEKAQECYRSIIKMKSCQSLRARHALVSYKFGQMKNNQAKSKDENDSSLQKEEARVFRYLWKLAFLRDEDSNEVIKEEVLYSISRMAVLILVGYLGIDKDERRDVQIAAKFYFFFALSKAIENIGLFLLVRSLAEQKNIERREQFNQINSLALHVLPKKIIAEGLQFPVCVPIVNFPYSVAYHLCWIAQRKLSTIPFCAPKTAGQPDDSPEQKELLSPELNKPEFYFRMMESIHSLETSFRYHQNGDAQYYLAQCHEKGYGAVINVPKAICFYQEAIKVKRAHALTHYFIPEEVGLEDVVKREEELRGALLPIKDAVLFIFQGFQLNNSTAVPLASEIAEFAMEIPRDSATPYEYMPEYQERSQTAVVAASPVASTATAAL